MMGRNKNKGSVSLKKYLKTIINLKHKHIKNSIIRTEESNRREIDLYKIEVNGHLKDLNNSHANIEKIASRNIGTDKFDGLVTRVENVEKADREMQGATKISDMVKLFIASIIGAGLTLLVQKLIG